MHAEPRHNRKCKCFWIAHRNEADMRVREQEESGKGEEGTEKIKKWSRGGIRFMQMNVRNTFDATFCIGIKAEPLAGSLCGFAVSATVRLLF